MRILDESRGVDVGRAAGSWKADELRRHTHDYQWTAISAQLAAGASWYSLLYQQFATSATGGIETRPRSIAYPGRIKLI